MAENKNKHQMNNKELIAYIYLPDLLLLSQYAIANYQLFRTFAQNSEI